MANLHQLLKAMLEKGASDLHVTTGTAPQLRVDGSLVPLNMPPLTPQETKQTCYSILTDAQKHRFEAQNELDLSFGVKGLARFRANIFVQRGAIAGVFRMIPYEIKPIGDLGVPDVIERFADKPSGLVLLTGPTGSGKSTTLASIIDQINVSTHRHIITIEDPIEYLHPHKGCVVNQREVGADTKTFEAALRYILRQDPDVVLIGEMRDLETIQAALTISETGHLCFATLHTNSAVQTINRVIDVFPSHQQAQVRMQLSFVLEGVVSQTLLARANSPGRVLAVEVMVPNPAIRNLIREDKVHQVYSQMQIGQDKFGMQTMNQSLAELYLKRMITYDDAMGRSSDSVELESIIRNPQGLGGVGKRQNAG